MSGLAALVAIRHQEPTDELAVNGLGGNDAISAAALAAQAITLTLDGGTGDDTIAGARASRPRSAATATTRSTATEVTTPRSWAPATTPSSGIQATAATPIEGQDGADTMLFNGANVAEKIDLSANGNRLRFIRATSPASRWTPTASRRVDFNALGGADLVTVNDLSGTDVSSVERRPRRHARRRHR